MRLVVISPSAALDTAELRKARGAFFTPEPVARYITDWAVRRHLRSGIHSGVSA